MSDDILKGTQNVYLHFTMFSGHLYHICALLLLQRIHLLSLVGQ